MNFFIYTLGCPKNEVDSDLLANAIVSSGGRLVQSPDQADVVVVNTCAFLQAAIEENIKVIKRFAALKEDLKFTLVVTGCLAQRLGSKLLEKIKHINLIVPQQDLIYLPRLLLEKQFNDKIDFTDSTYFYKSSRDKSFFSSRAYSYLKISEGCNRPCSFCVIPRIRGKFRSKPIHLILEEAQNLLDQGFKEIILVAQDLSSYGLDLYGKQLLPSLLKSLNSLEGDFWIRLLYLYPLGLTDELLDTILESDKVCNYIDIPFQHCSKKILQTMARPLGQFSPDRIVEKIKSKKPDLAIRTTFIVGFPGETDEDFQQLCNFVKQYELHSVGVFIYSDEDKARSYEFKNKVPYQKAAERRDLILGIQKEVSRRLLSRFIGKRLKVLVEGKKKSAFVGRTYFQAPEIDGITFVQGSCKISSFTDCIIQQSLDYDLIASSKKLALAQEC